MLVTKMSKIVWTSRSKIQNLKNRMDFWDPHEQDTGVFSDTHGSVLGNDCAAWRGIAARSGLEGSQTPKTPNLHGKSLVRSLGGASQARGDLNTRKSLYPR